MNDFDLLTGELLSAKLPLNEHLDPDADMLIKKCRWLGEH